MSAAKATRTERSGQAGRDGRRTGRTGRAERDGRDGRRTGRAERATRATRATRAATAARAATLRPLRPLRHREYRLLALSLVASLFSAGLLVVSLVWQVVALGGGPSELAWATTAQATGVLAAALPGGVAADRLPQRGILLAVEFTKAVAVGSVAIASLTGQLHLTHLVVVALLGGIADGLYFPAYTALLPKLVDPSDLLAANGLEGVFRPTLVNAAGPAVAGAVVAAVSPGAALGLVAACALLAGLVLLPLRSRPASSTVATESGGTAAADGPGSTDPGSTGAAPGTSTVLRDLLDGFRFMLRTRWLWATLAFASLAVLAFMGPLDVLLPFAIKDNAGGGPGDHALVLAAFGAGGALASLYVASRPMPRRYLTVMIMLWGWGGLPMAALGLTSSVTVMVVAAFAVGASFQAATVIWGTLLQRRVPPELLGRVSSLDFFVSLLFMPVSMGLAVPISHVIGLSGAFIAAAVLPAVLAVVTIIGARLPADEAAHPLHEEQPVGGDGPDATSPQATTPRATGSQAAGPTQQ